MPSGYPVNADLLKNIDTPSQIVFFYDSLDEWSQFMLYMLQSISNREERFLCIVSPSEEKHLKTFIDYKRQDVLWDVSLEQIVIIPINRDLELTAPDPAKIAGLFIEEVRNSIGKDYKKIFMLISLDAMQLTTDSESFIVALSRHLKDAMDAFPCVSIYALNSKEYSTDLLQKLFLQNGQFIKNLKLYQNPYYNGEIPDQTKPSSNWLDSMVERIDHYNLQELWESFIARTFHAIAIYTEDGRMLQCNLAFCSLLGLSEEQIRGITLQSLLSQTGCGTLSNLEEFHACVGKYLTPDNRELALELLLQRVADSAGKPYYTVSLADITEKQRLADRMQALEGELETILSSINDTIMLLDNNLVYTGIYGHGFFGEDLAPELFVGKTPAQVWVKEKAELFQQFYERALAGENVTYEYSLGSRTSPRFYQSSLAPLRDRQQQITGIIGISRNISELKNAQKELQRNYEEIEAMNQDLEFYQNRLMKKNEELRESQNRLELALWGAREAFWDWDLANDMLHIDDKWVDVNKSMKKSDNIFTYSDIISIMHPDDRDNFRTKTTAFLKGESEHLEVEYRISSGDSWIWLLVKGRVASRDSNGRALRLVGTYQDISEKKRADSAYKEIEQRYQTLFEQTPIGLVRFDSRGVITDANARFLALMGAADKDAIKDLNLLYSKEAKDAGLEDRIKECMENKTASQGELLFGLPGGKKIWLRYNIDPVLNQDGSLREVIMACEDYTEKKANEMKIMYLSFHDRLTGLYNRAFFEEELKRIDVERQLPLSIAMGDINGLKLVNDAFGHQEGDRLLRKIADILRQSCREEDIIARWGGDEFIILLPQTDHKTAANICERIKRNAASAEASPIALSIALGYAAKENTGQNINEILKKAENDMYLNKLMESKTTRSAIIASLEQTLWERTVETREHTERMQRIALRMAAGMGMRKHDADKLMLLAKLHDIGKIGIPDEVLRKPGVLLPEEWDTVKKHSEIGYRIVNASPELSVISEEILSHHERWNGLGYPRGLKGEEIPRLARVISIIDAYDVMTHQTPYKDPISHEQALSELQRNAGLQFDPKLVEIFVYNFA